MIEAGTTRFRVTQSPGRRTLDKDSLAGELTELFHDGGMDDVDVYSLMARHEKISAPSTRLFINKTNKQEKTHGGTGLMLAWLLRSQPYIHYIKN